MSKKNEPEKLPFDSPEFEAAWNEWIEYRRERRLPSYKPIGQKKTFAGLLRDSENDEATAIAMINQAMEKNWQGIYPLIVKNGTNQQSTQPAKPGRSEINDRARSEY